MIDIDHLATFAWIKRNLFLMTSISVPQSIGKKDYFISGRSVFKGFLVVFCVLVLCHRHLRQAQSEDKNRTGGYGRAIPAFPIYFMMHGIHVSASWTLSPRGFLHHWYRVHCIQTQGMLNGLYGRKYLNFIAAFTKSTSIDSNLKALDDLV